ncbi:hypothetical protein LRS03_00350 [Rhizobacter sp. J219]|uniref:RHS repeat domain-containing protein n=1 Tax=Rhizobacter sp. J219 TaxID=2898430 RepID=UPI0021512FD1|nr:hypothetical protein [Rhizobacter sp. J219]MCR5881395.1 hypothetical protein [Rhizobacter sp. J219]
MVLWSLLGVRRTNSVAARLLGATTICVTFTLAGFAGVALAADIRDQCADRRINGAVECTYRPHIIEPFKYRATGPYETTSIFLDEDGAKGEMGELIAAKCPDCCDAGRLVSESGWVDAGSGPSWAWLPDLEGGKLNHLTYSFSRNCQTPQTVTSLLSKWRSAYCELGWTHQYFADQTLCTRPRRNQECLTRNPIAVPSLAKVFREEDYKSVANQSLRFVRHYRSEGFAYPPGFAGNLWHGLGTPWTHNYAGGLFVTEHSVWLMWGTEALQHFQLASGSGFPRVLLPLKTSQQARLVESSPGTYDYYSANNELIRFVGGLPTTVVSATGRSIRLSYGGAGIAVVQDASGRTLTFGYGEDDHLVSLSDPSGAMIRYDYKPRRQDLRQNWQQNSTFTSLVRVRFQDQQFVEYRSPDWDYSNPASNSSQWATRLTAVIDEVLGKEYKRVVYSRDGTVLSSELANGIDRYSVTGGGILDPLGSVRRYTFTGVLNAPDGVYQPEGSGCAASYANVGYDSNGNVASRDDFNRKRVCYANDSSRSLETVRVEGLVAGQACGALVSVGAVLPADSRKTSTQWHPHWRLETKVAEPGRIVTSVYNGQPDPFNGNAVANCAPASALLPDGKPIAVLCKRVEQATADTNGSAGFGATLQAGVPDRVSTWTYNQWGQVLSENGPRTDINDSTSYAYYSNTSFTGEGSAAEGHFMGDLERVTNAAGQSTRYTKYNKHGQLLESVDPNGVVTTNTYDLRQRLLSTSTGGQTTRYQYDLAGQLTRVTLPDQTWVGYDYDDAHRQVAVYDHKGNRIDYVLDNAGNRIGENTRDPGGNLKRQLVRSIDALGRVQRTTGRE